MKAHLRRLLSTVGNTFWILLGAIVVAGILLALGLVELERSGAIPPWLIASPWLYLGGATGARTLLGGGCIHHRRCRHSPLNYNSSVIAGSRPDGSPTASQLYPRPRQPTCVRRVPWHILIRADGASQHAHAQQSEFIAYFLLSAGILLAFVCISTLVFFVGHMAGRINVDTVVSLASGDIRVTVGRLMLGEKQHPSPPDSPRHEASVVTDGRRGYLRQFDGKGLADWAVARSTALRILVRRGDYVFPGAAVALVEPPVDDGEQAIRSTIVVGSERASDSDLEFSVRQLVEVAVRALSPGINDPHTAMSVLDHLGATLCDAVPLHYPAGSSCVRDVRCLSCRQSTMVA